MFERYFDECPLIVMLLLVEVAYCIGLRCRSMEMMYIKLKYGCRMIVEPVLPSTPDPEYKRRMQQTIFVSAKILPTQKMMLLKSNNKIQLCKPTAWYLSFFGNTKFHL